MAAEEQHEITWNANRRTRNRQISILENLLEQAHALRPNDEIRRIMMSEYPGLDVDQVFTESIRRKFFKPEHLQRNNEGCNYKILKVLGEGLHSCVVLAEALEPSVLPTGKLVALKHVKRNIFAYNANVHKKVTDIYIKRILRELKIFHYTINSNHISKLLDVWTPGDNYLNDFDTLYSCTELCDCDFQDIFDGKKLDFEITYDIACKWAFQMIESLNELHFADIVHRDIKPDNLLLDHEGNVKLTDFNLGRFVDSDNLESTSAKNFFTRNLIAKYYRPFEVFFRMDGVCRTKVPMSEADKIDVWCVGLIIYELLTLMTGNKHRLIQPERSRAILDAKAESEKYCDTIIRKVGAPSKKYFRKNEINRAKIEHYNKIAANRKDFENSVYEEFKDLIPADVNPENSLIGCLLKMIHPEPSCRISFEEALNEPCFQRSDLQAMRSTRKDKAKELLRYIVMFDGMKEHTDHFFEKKNMTDIRDIAMGELQKEPKWFRGLHCEVRKSLVDGFKNSTKTNLGFNKFVKSRGPPFNPRKAKQLERYIQDLEKAAASSSEKIKRDPIFETQHEHKFFNKPQKPEWFAQLDEENQRQVQDSFSHCIDVDEIVKEYKNLFGKEAVLSYGNALDYLDWSEAISEVSIPDVWNQLDENTRQKLKILFENTLYGESLKDELMNICKIDEDDASKIINYYTRQNSSVNLLDLPMPSNFGDGNVTEMNETISGDDEQKIENLKTLAREGKTDMSKIDRDRVDKMYDWIDTEMCFKEYKTEEKLQELYGLFAHEFELENESTGQQLFMAIFVEYLLMEIVDDEMVYSTLRHKFLLSQKELGAYLKEYFETDAKPMTETAFVSCFVGDVLEKGTAWIFDFEKHRHLDGESIKELINQEIAVIRKRCLDFQALEQRKQSVQLIPDKHSDEESLSNDVCPQWYVVLNQENRINVRNLIGNAKKGGEDLENTIMDNTGISREHATSFINWWFNGRNLPAPELWEKLNKKQQKKMQLVLADQKDEISEENIDTVMNQNVGARTREEAKDFLIWYFEHPKTKTAKPCTLM